MSLRADPFLGRYLQCLLGNQGTFLWSRLMPMIEAL